MKRDPRIETVDLPVRRFRCKSGKPTCALNMEKGEFCQFLLSRRFGTTMVCGVFGRDIPYFGRGWPKPLADCPVWAGVKEKP